MIAVACSLPRKYGIIFYANMESSFTQIWNRHFDRSCSQSHREQRSGEIRFSTAAPTRRNPVFAYCCCVACTRRCLCLYSPLPVPVLAVACSCCHPERSEGSRRTQQTQTIDTFQPILLCAFCRRLFSIQNSKPSSS